MGGSRLPCSGQEAPQSALPESVPFGRARVNGAERSPFFARGAHWLGALGRLRAGPTPEAARLEMAAIGADPAREYPRDIGSLGYVRILATRSASTAAERLRTTIASQELRVAPDFSGYF